jgi:hypothetical protein
MPEVTNVNEIYLKGYSGSINKNTNSYIGRSSSEASDSEVIVQKILSLYINYPATNNAGYDGTLEVRISPSLDNIGTVIFSCNIKPGETVIPISKKVQPIYLHSGARILCKIVVNNNATNPDYIMSVEEHRSV